jgi:spermidine synthase
VLVGWHRRFLAGLTGAALADPRTSVHVGDVVRLVRAAAAGSWDAVCLDVDNGPDWLARPQNARLYDGSGVRALARALGPRGALAVWSAAPAPGLEARLRDVFADVRVLRPRSRTDLPDWVVVAGTADPAAASDPR